MHITPLVNRHAQDAAFYWAQYGAARHSPLIGPDRLAHFNRLLDAHLDGLLVAGEVGWDAAFQQLERWQGPGEAFVCAWLALRDMDSAKIRLIWPVIAAQPQRVLRGVIAALVRIDAQSAALCIQRWMQIDGFAPLQVAALRAAFLRDGDKVDDLEDFCRKGLQSPDPYVQAAACRLASRVEAGDIRQALQERRKHPDTNISAEAAISLLKTDDQSAWSFLADAITAEAAELNGLSGWERDQAIHKLTRWVQHAGIHAAENEQAMPLLRDVLPARAAINLAMYHGHIDSLAWLKRCIAEGKAPRYAGWAWESITGLDLEANQFCAPQVYTEADVLTVLDDDDDAGLRLPIAARLPDASTLNLPQGPLLFGLNCNAGRLLEIRNKAPGALARLAELRLEAMK
ncbi:HEAT repeat domain-containing protein [Chitinimonas sp.]|uniref:HEAT repeat domain-containing protein n=1 Tax=Chitinimonas sp. TaxID=1934313 RepID=UPI002F95A45D